jgi:hypothetical protein
LHYVEEFFSLNRDTLYLPLLQKAAVPRKGAEQKEIHEEIYGVLCRRSATLEDDEGEEEDWSDDDSEGGGMGFSTMELLRPNLELLPASILEEEPKELVLRRESSLQPDQSGSQSSDDSVQSYTLTAEKSFDVAEELEMEEEELRGALDTVAMPTSRVEGPQKAKKGKAKKVKTASISARSEELDEMEVVSDDLWMNSALFSRDCSRVRSGGGGGSRKVEVSFEAGFDADDDAYFDQPAPLRNELPLTEKQKTVPRWEKRGAGYPSVQERELKLVFQRQHDTGCWELGSLELLKIDAGEVQKMLELAGCKSLGKAVCTDLFRLLTTITILKILSGVFGRRFPLTFTPKLAIYGTVDAEFAASVERAVAYFNRMAATHPSLYARLELGYSWEDAANRITSRCME